MLFSDSLSINQQSATTLLHQQKRRLPTMESLLQILVVLGILIMIGGGIKMYFDKKNNSTPGK
jgi:hypothetical protein